MDLEQAMTIDGIVTDLVPDVDEFAVVSSFFHFTEGLKSAKGIQEKDSVFFKPFIGIAKIFDHGGSILEDPVAEIHGEYQINRIIPDLHNIFIQQQDSFFLCAGPRGALPATAARKAMTPSVIQGA